LALSGAGPSAFGNGASLGAKGAKQKQYIVIYAGLCSVGLGFLKIKKYRSGWELK